jgi:hypothetical protein
MSLAPRAPPRATNKEKTMKISPRIMIGALVLAATVPLSLAPPAGAGSNLEGVHEMAPSDRARPTMTLTSSEYTVETIFVPAGDPPTASMYFRRTDLVGNNVPGPDRYGSASYSDWGDLSGRRCLLSGGGVHTSGAEPHTFTYGLAGRGIARIRIVEAGGHVVRVRPGPPVHFKGFRAWLIERPGSSFDRIEGLDARGRVVATIPAGGGPFADDFDYAQATC